MIITKDYKLLKREELYYVISNENLACPACRGKLFLIGSRKRKLILSNSEKISLVIKRHRCESCRKIHHELPLCCIPYKRYESKVIEDIIKECAREKKKERTGLYPCEKSTTVRIIFWYRNILLWLRILLERNKIKCKYSFIKNLSFSSFSKSWLGYLFYELIKVDRKIFCRYSYVKFQL